jgi:membrane protein YqaA with SNARE-associated domain
MQILRKLYNWTIKKSAHKNASWFLSLISFAESSFFPIPPDIILIPMVIAKKTRAFFYAFLCTVSSVLGGIAGYCIGYFLFNSLGILILNYYGLTDQFANFEKYYNIYGIWIVLGAGFTPFPFKFITIASGVFGLNIFLFLGISIIARGLRFYLIAFLLKIFGSTIEKLIDKYFNLLASLFFIILIGSIILLKFL